MSTVRGRGSAPVRRPRRDPQTYVRAGSRALAAVIAAVWVAATVVCAGLGLVSDVPAAYYALLLGVLLGALMAGLWVAVPAGDPYRPAEDPAVDPTASLLGDAPQLWTVRADVRAGDHHVDHVVTCSAGVLAVVTRHSTRTDEDTRARHVEHTVRVARALRAVLRDPGLGAADVPVIPVLLLWGRAAAGLGADARWVDGVLVVPGPAGAAAFAVLPSGVLDRGRARHLDRTLGEWADGPGRPRISPRERIPAPPRTPPRRRTVAHEPSRTRRR